MTSEVRYRSWRKTFAYFASFVVKNCCKKHLEVGDAGIIMRALSPTTLHEMAMDCG